MCTLSQLSSLKGCGAVSMLDESETYRVRVLQLYNVYQSGGGGETRVVELIEQVLKLDGHDVKTLVRDSTSIQGLVGKISAAVTAPYSLTAKRCIREELLAWHPDIVHVHNLYPLLSPSVLEACNEVGVPVVMTVHNYRLTCPAGTHFHNGSPCTRCLGGHEYQCIHNNCEDDLFKSAAYAFRSYIARSKNQFVDGVTLFLAISRFVKEQLINAGFREDQIVVLENATPIPALVNEKLGNSVTYLGRMQPEKGVDALLQAAAQLPHLQFVFVGEGASRTHYMQSATPNCSFLGHQNRVVIDGVFKDARMVVVPSTWWEPFGLVAIEAMSHGRPIIVARSGALPELVREGVCGLTYDATNVTELTSAIQTLWDDDARANAMGKAARQLASDEYNVESYSKKLTAFYEAAHQKYRYRTPR